METPHSLATALAFSNSGSVAGVIVVLSVMGGLRPVMLAGCKKPLDFGLVETYFAIGQPNKRNLARSGESFCAPGPIPE